MNENNKSKILLNINDIQDCATAKQYTLEFLKIINKNKKSDRVDYEIISKINN